jgi:integrase
VAYLMNRDGKLYFRRRVPDELREIVGKREWKASLKLKVGQELDAVEPVRRLTRETDRWEREAQRQLASGLPEAEMAEVAYEWARKAELLKGGLGRRSDPGRPSDLDWQIEEIVQRTLRATKVRDEHDLSDADFRPEDLMKLKTLREGTRVEVPCTIRMAEEHYKKRKKEKYAKVERIAVDDFVEFAGDMALADIRRTQVQDWIDYLSETRGNMPSTQQRRLNSLRAIVNMAILDLGLDCKNPFEKHKVAQSGKSEDRLPFHSSHLEKLSAYLRSGKPKPETRLMLTLMLETTAGVSEVGGLDWEDVRLDDAIPHLKFRPNGHRGLKTGDRTRDFPLVGEGLDLLRTHRRGSSGRGAVFSQSALNFHSLSARLTKAVRAAGVPKSTRLTAYSGRHTFEEAMRVAGVEYDLQQYLMGHANRNMTDRYGASQPLMERLKAAIIKALPQRGKVNEANYREDELPR